VLKAAFAFGFATFVTASAACAGEKPYDFENPRAPHELIGQAEVWTPDEVGGVAHKLDAESYWLTPDPVIILTDGMTRIDKTDYGLAHVGEIDEGVWANRTDGVHLVMIDPNGDPVEVFPGDVIAVGDSLPWMEMTRRGLATGRSDDGCKVTCRDGYYACCNASSCRCVRSGEGAECEAGGEGAVSCDTRNIKPVVPDN